MILPRPEGECDSADLPGSFFTFTQMSRKTAPTQGTNEAQSTGKAVPRRLSRRKNLATVTCRTLFPCIEDARLRQPGMVNREETRRSIDAGPCGPDCSNGRHARQAFLFDWEEYRRTGKRRYGSSKNAEGKGKIETKRIAYKGREVVRFQSPERPGTIIIKTKERYLYQVLANGKAKRFMVAVGKEGFSWSGIARIGMKRENPTWTPPAEMIERTPKYAKWADGMPGGIPENPLGPRALYLFNKTGDTQYRIHGTNAPSSIGTAASSGCIRMLNKEVIELYESTPVGTKVIVI